MKYLLMIVAFVLSALGAGCVVSRASVPLGVILLAGSVVCVYQGCQIRRTSTEEITAFKSQRLDNCDNSLLVERYVKAVADFNYLQSAVPKVQDHELAGQLMKIQGIAGRIIDYLQKNPDKLTVGRQFVDYYQDRAVVLVQKYFSLEETNLQTPQVVEMKARLKETLNSFDEAYEEQFNKILNDQLLDVDAELKVVRQMFDSDGIKPDSHKAANEETVYDSRKFRVESGEEPQRSEKDKIVDDSESAFGPFRMIKSMRNGRGCGWMKNGGRGCEERNSADTVEMDEVIPKGLNSDVLKTKVIAGVLGIFLGWTGAHKFYLRKKVQGTFYLLFCWTFLPGLFGFIEGVRYLFMRKDDFYFQYYKQ